MKVFELLRAFILILPLGIFLTFTLMVVVNSTMKVKKADGLFRRITGFYCGMASVASFILITYYYMPDLFARLVLLYLFSVIISMVLFYHFFHYATSPGVRFRRLHYVLPSVICAILLFLKILLPDVWAQEDAWVLFVIALFFGIFYSLLTLVRIQRYFIELSINQNKVLSINNLQTAMYAVETILFPIIFIFFPLVGGQTPSVIMSSLLMVSILLGLRANIPFTYTTIRHYISFDTQSRSLFEELVLVEQPRENKSNKEKGQEIVAKQQAIATAPTREKSKKMTGKKPQVEFPAGFDKKMFNNFMRRHKPFLNPDITITDVAKALESNRTYVSAFVNKAYKMNFSSYINLSRLREMNRLLALPKNKGRTPAELIPQTGFGTIRNYLRTQEKFDTRGKKIKKTKNKND